MGKQTTACRALLTAGILGGLLAGCNGDPSGDCISDSSPIASLEISGLTATFTVGDSTRYTVTPLDSLGNPLSGYAAHWSSSKPAVATVGTNGEVRALAAGTAFIRVRVVPKADRVHVTCSRSRKDQPRPKIGAPHHGSSTGTRNPGRRLLLVPGSGLSERPGSREG